MGGMSMWGRPNKLAALGLGVCALGLACLNPVSFSLAGHPCTADDDCGGSGLVCGASARCVSNGGADGYVPPQPPFPLRAATYTGSFPYFWSLNPHGTPTMGRYSTLDAGVLAAQLQAFAYGHIDVGLYNNDGNGSDSDQFFARDIDRTLGSDFHWAVQYMVEQTSPGSVDVAHAGFALRDIRDRYGSHPNYLRIGGKYAVFVRSSGASDPCEVASRWVVGNRTKNAGAFLVLRTEQPPTGKYRACAEQPDAWYSLGEGAAASVNDDGLTLSPGYFQYDKTTPVLPRDVARFTGALELPHDGGLKFQVITSFNEWAAGTQVESAVEWASDSGYGQYLDALHEHPLR